MIEIKHVTKSYHIKDVLKDINVTIPKHKITALIGANGAGKSTLLGIMARLFPANQGDIYLDGENMNLMTSNHIAKKLSILKQTNQIGMRVTIKELVSFGRFPHSKGRLNDIDNIKINESIAYMDLTSREHDYIDELSGGQRQRAYIAMILAQDTPYILLDEPLNNLDMKYAIEMMTILQKLVKELGKTIIVVMHDINFAAAFADHIIAMKGGEIIAEGDVDKMMDKKILDHTFDHDFCIAGYQGKKICLYYQHNHKNNTEIV